MILAGDVGGTKILLEVGDFRSRRGRPALARRYLLADFQSMDGVLERFLAEWEKVKRPRTQIEGAALGVAGPAFGNRVVMTNHPWRIDGDILAQRFDLPNLRVINDLAAAAHGLDSLGSKDVVTLQPGKAVTGAPRVLIGVGTGLGVAYMFPEGKPKPGPGTGQVLGTGVGHVRKAHLSQVPVPYLAPVRVVAGEGGHVGFSPASAEQRELFRKLSRTRARVEAEHVVSGAALQRDGIALFSSNLGNVAGDHALSVLACGGVYLCGGVIARSAATLRKEAFRAAFAAKGAHSALLMRIPVRIVLSERLPLLGAARHAFNA